jgi:hypothetical protein
MKPSSGLLGSPSLTAILLALIASSFIAENRISARARERQVEGQKFGQAAGKASALVNAIEQYYIDFPDASSLANKREWTERLGGRNPKNIRYLKVEKYSTDSGGRLLDPCGKPWEILVQGSPGFHPVIPEGGDSEFHVVPSDDCGYFAYGNLRMPHYVRSY